MKNKNSEKLFGIFWKDLNDSKKKTFLKNVVVGCFSIVSNNIYTKNCKTEQSTRKSACYILWYHQVLFFLSLFKILWFKKEEICVVWK